jgi:hypothetical protein
MNIVLCSFKYKQINSHFVLSKLIYIGCFFVINTNNTHQIRETSKLQDYEIQCSNALSYKRQKCVFYLSLRSTGMFVNKNY